MSFLTQTSPLASPFGYIYPTSVRVPGQSATNVGLTSSNSKCRVKAVRVDVNGKLAQSTVGPNGSSLDPELANGHAGKANGSRLATVGKSTNIKWHECSVEKADRQKILNQKGCVIWITGLSGSGKSTVASALSQSLYQRGKLTYVLDGDNVRHGLNRDLSFKPEDRSENIRRVGQYSVIDLLDIICSNSVKSMCLKVCFNVLHAGEVAKLFADAGVICIACLISPLRVDRDACRDLLPSGEFIEVFMDVCLEVCEARDPKGLYKLARAGKIKGFTGIDDPYEPPSNPEIVLKCNTEDSSSPCEMAEKVIAYLEKKGFLQA